MLPLPHVLDLLANKLACLRTWRLPLTLVFACSLQGLFFRHHLFPLHVIKTKLARTRTSSTHATNAFDVLFFGKQ